MARRVSSPWMTSKRVCGSCPTTNGSWTISPPHLPVPRFICRAWSPTRRQRDSGNSFPRSSLCPQAPCSKGFTCSLMHWKKPVLRRRQNSTWTHALTNPIPLSGHVQLRCEQAQTELAGGAVARRFELAASLSGAKTVSQSEPSRAWWTNLEPYLLDWECCLTEFQSPKIQAA